MDESGGWMHVDATLDQTRWVDRWMGTARWEKVDDTSGPGF